MPSIHPFFPLIIRNSRNISFGWTFSHCHFLMLSDIVTGSLYDWNGMTWADEVVITAGSTGLRLMNTQSKIITLKKNFNCILNVK